MLLKNTEGHAEYLWFYALQVSAETVHELRPEESGRFVAELGAKVVEGALRTLHLDRELRVRGQ